MNVFRNILEEIEIIKKDRIGELGRRLKEVSAMRDPSGRGLTSKTRKTYAKNNYQ